MSHVNCFQNAWLIQRGTREPKLFGCSVLVALWPYMRDGVASLFAFVLCCFAGADGGGSAEPGSDSLPFRVFQGLWRGKHGWTGTEFTGWWCNGNLSEDPWCPQHQNREDTKPLGKRQLLAVPNRSDYTCDVASTCFGLLRAGLKKVQAGYQGCEAHVLQFPKAK